MAVVLRVDDIGQAWVDDRLLPLRPGDDPARALIEHTQTRARSLGHALSAHVIDASGTDTWVKVSPQGELTPMDPEPETPPVAREPERLSRWETPVSSPARSHAVRMPRRSREPRQGTRLNRRRLLLGGVGVLAAGALSAAVWPESDHAPVPQVELLPGQFAPAGWNARALWSIPNVLSFAPIMNTRDDLAAVFLQPPGAAALTVQVFHPSSGKKVWDTTLPAGTTSINGPLLVTIAGRLCVYVLTETTVFTWDAYTGKAMLNHPTVAQNPGNGVNLLGPWINEHGPNFTGITTSGLKSFTIPTGASPFGVFHDQMIAVNNKAQVWKLESRKPAPQPVTLPGPAGMSAGIVVGLTETLLMLSWTNGPNVIVRGYDLATLKPVWDTPAQQQWATFVSTTLISPDQSWATIGNRSVDLATGHTRTVAPRWNPAVIGDTFACGDDGQFLMTCNRSGVVTSGTPTHNLNATPRTSAGGHDVLLATGSIGQQNTLYGLTPSRK